MPVQMIDAEREDSSGCCAAAMLRTERAVLGPRRAAETRRCCRATDAELRQAYFSQAGLIAARYGVRFERVLEHLRAARARHPHLAIPVLAHMDDLVHAVACVDGCDLAWRDLGDAHERGLIRACREWMDGTDAIVLVRRLFAELRHQVPGIQPLQTYDGTCPLRKWLGDRVIGRLNQVEGGFARPREHRNGLKYASARRPGEGRRRLAEGHFLEGDIIWQAASAAPPARCRVAAHPAP
jgi:hypothetical protein